VPRLTLGHFAKIELRASEHDRKQVVEVVGDTAGQDAETLELLRVQELSVRRA
jgi:hypothetical protein